MCSTEAESHATTRSRQDTTDPFSETEDDSDAESRSKQEDFSALECKENVTGKYILFSIITHFHVLYQFLFTRIHKLIPFHSNTMISTLNNN